MQLVLTAGDVRALQAVALATSPDKTRPILTGVFITPAAMAPDNGTDFPFTVQGCDSYRLAWHGLSGGDEAYGASDLEPVLIPAKALVAALKGLKVPTKASISSSVAILSVDAINGTWTLKGCGLCSGSLAGGITIEGTYPDTRQLVPGSYAPEVGQGEKGIAGFNAEFLGTLGEVSKTLKLNAEPCTLKLNDSTRPARFDIEYQGRKFSYLMMPVRF